MFGLATSENEGETSSTRQTEAEEPAPKGAKPKAKRDAPTQSQSSAKPADPLRHAALSANKALPDFSMPVTSKLLVFGAIT